MKTTDMREAKPNPSQAEQAQQNTHREPLTSHNTGPTQLLGIAKGRFEVPAIIDADNGKIIDLFLAPEFPGFTEL